MNKRIFYILLVLFLLSFFLRFTLAFYSPIKYWDETIYANLGRNILIYEEYSFQHGFADFSPNWPLAGFRPPLLPFIISIISFFSFSKFLLNFIIPIISSIGVIGFFFLSKELFNEKIALYSSLLFAIFPMNIFWGSKILTDTLFLTMIIFSVYFFYLAFFKNYKPLIMGSLFGIFAGLAFLSRYSMVWFLPLFLLLLFLKYKNLGFLKEGKFWISAMFFLVIITPWFIYNYFQYGSWLGFLIQANQASLRWGTQSFFFYFSSFLKDFLILIPFFILGLLSKKYNESKIFMFLWFLIIFLAASFLSHKEPRYLLPILPAICAVSALGIIKIKKYSKFIFLILVLILLTFNYLAFKPTYYSFNSPEQKCFFDAMDFIKNSGASYVVTEHFSPVYFYTQKQNIRVDNYTVIKDTIERYHKGKTIYYYYVNGDWFNLKAENETLGEPVYSCDTFNIFDISFK